jgi:hypothetical protein
MDHPIRTPVHHRTHEIPDITETHEELVIAQHLLTLAEDSVPHGAHVHLDAARELDDASLDLVIERG